jgi:hypothetical protein
LVMDLTFILHPFRVKFYFLLMNDHFTSEIYVIDVLLPLHLSPQKSTSHAHAGISYECQLYMHNFGSLRSSENLFPRKFSFPCNTNLKYLSFAV